MNGKHIIVFAALLVSVIFHTPAASQSIIFSPEIIQTVEDSRANDAYWSVIFRDSTGTILEGYNFEKIVRPASNLKLLTSSAILDELGTEFTYKTYVYGLGSQEGDTWKGDIIVRGTGDPSISGTYYGENKFHVFDKFYETLDSLGIREIEGNLIGNDSYFDQQPYPKGWSWEDLSFYYGVEISALSFNNNAVDLQVFANDEIGETPRIQWFPFDTDYVTFVNEQTITPPDSEYDEFYRRVLGTNTIILRSKVPQNYDEKESLSVMNASMFFMDTFKEYLKDGGIETTGRILIDSQPHDWNSGRYQELAVHESVPLGQLMEQVNKDSENFYTEMLLKTAAAEKYDAQGSTELGISLVKEFAARTGIDTSRVEMNDGSGMSPGTLLSPSAITHLLVEMQHHPEFKAFRNSLSIAGLDGSLENRFTNTPMAGNLRGKTGFVSGVRALSGYMKSATGRTLVFSVVTNNYTNKTSYIDYLQESIIRQMYEKY